jgi:hypothetical protein
MTEKIEARQLSKQDAIKQLIHGAVRLLMSAEDPFIIHMLIQSADKLLIDVAKQSGQKLAHDWEEFIVPEKKGLFFTKYRETYNFFKHANHDFGKDLPVHDIVKLNLITLFVVIQNYHALYGAYTGHMVLLNSLVQCTIPGMFLMDKMSDEAAAHHKKLLKSLDTTTPTEFFSIISEYIKVFAPTYQAERDEDLQDNKEFFPITFAELHKRDEASMK